MGIKEQLSEKTGLAKDLLPSGYQMIGDIIILNLRPGLPAKKIALAIHELVPSAKTIMQKVSGIKGAFRVPQLKKLWGNGTITIHKEHDCLFEMDVTKVMWAKGNLAERKRLALLVKPNELVSVLLSVSPLKLNASVTPLTIDGSVNANIPLSK